MLPAEGDLEAKADAADLAAAAIDPLHQNGIVILEIGDAAGAEAAAVDVDVDGEVAAGAIRCMMFRLKPHLVASASTAKART